MATKANRYLDEENGLDEGRGKGGADQPASQAWLVGILLRLLLVADHSKLGDGQDSQASKRRVSWLSQWIDASDGVRCCRNLHHVWWYVIAKGVIDPFGPSIGPPLEHRFSARKRPLQLPYRAYFPCKELHLCALQHLYTRKTVSA